MAQDLSRLKEKIAVLGVGRMGEALIKGLLRSMPPKNMMACIPANSHPAVVTVVTSDGAIINTASQVMNTSHNLIVWKANIVSSLARPQEL